MSAYWPNPGFEWNPLRGHRNIACPCGSSKKAKRCHGLAEIVTAEMAAEIRKYLRELSGAGLIRARKGEIRP